MNTTTQNQLPNFLQIDAAALKAIAERSKASDNVVGSVKCKTIAEGRRFRHLN